MKSINIPKNLLLTSLLLLAPVAHSSVVYMDFDSVNALGGDVDATSYLASYGITLTNVSNPGTLRIIDDRSYYGGGVVTASSGHNFLEQNVTGSPNGISYTLNFSTPLSSLSFTRIAVNLPTAVAQWTATAYAGATTVGSVGEGFFSGTHAAQTYSLSGAGITSLTIAANGYNFAGIPSATLDDFYLTQVASPVPVPAAAWLFGSGLLGLMGVARKRKTA